MILPFRDPHPDRPRLRTPRCSVRVTGRLYSFQREALRIRHEERERLRTDPPKPA